ncbi:MAG: MmcQ/YjbR family DNA-binding protein [Bacteroidetes bacterium]|nr:MmcQ/YjbR family DNA-binding protein [Bacteroidota bacterium]MBL6943581.1 MmcQ/YjbR family DNA-binding protein [Bacteroidales bacterium]
MNIEEIRSFCLNKKGVTEGFPFDDTTLVFKVAGKIFALVNLKDSKSINLKCDPDKALELREHHSSVIPGYHMNKIHWNTIILDETIPDQLLREWIIDSYMLIVDKLPTKLKQDLH